MKHERQQFSVFQFNLIVVNSFLLLSVLLLSLLTCDKNNAREHENSSIISVGDAQINVCQRVNERLSIAPAV